VEAAALGEILFDLGEDPFGQLARRLPPLSASWREKNSSQVPPSKRQDTPRSRDSMAVALRLRLNVGTLIARRIPGPGVAIAAIAARGRARIGRSTARTPGEQ
jgi:hypothetical protein